jgi:large subunit ribosomal protein L5e
MAFLKKLKTVAWFKKYQCKKRRRHEGKTDYKQRRNMVKQAKNKYNSPKYRLVVRFTNKNIICQVAYATIIGDRTICQATSAELPKYGIKAGLTNYAAAYATGLLVGRRLLKKYGMDDEFKGVEEHNAEEYHIEDEHEGDKRPFKVLLDVGLMRTSVGARCFGAMKGAADAGLHVPHTTKRFPGYEPPAEKGADPNYEAETHKARILGSHVGEYMEMLEEEDPTKYEAHFAKFIAAGISGGDISDMYSGAHAKIKEDPSFTPKDPKNITNKRVGKNILPEGGAKYQRNVRLTLKQRKEKVRQKISTAQKKALAAAAADDDE